MSKVLFSATVDEHIISFHIPYMKLFKEQGYEVHVASKGIKNIPFVDKKYNIDFERFPLKISNYTAYKELKKIINENNYAIIHTHTPTAAALTRIASREAKSKGTKIIYTAHGFHFFRGAPFGHWIIFYPIEKWLSKYTNCLITINEEDYNTAIKGNFKADKIKMVHGVGVDLQRFTCQTESARNKIRKEYGYKEDDIILFYAAELNYNKNQNLLIDVVNLLKNKIPNIKLLLAGTGGLEHQYRKRVGQLGLDSYIEFIGYRTDIPSLLVLSDIVVASSKREGLPVNIMEAMATGLPLVVTDIRGHRDLVCNGENGYVINYKNTECFAEAIERLYEDFKSRYKYGLRSLTLIQKYSLENVLKEMEELYKDELI